RSSFARARRASGHHWPLPWSAIARRGGAMDDPNEPAPYASPEQGEEEEKNHSDRPALDAFSKWSNYLLVTTVAAVGWISSGHVKFRNVMSSHSKTLRTASELGTPRSALTMK